MANARVEALLNRIELVAKKFGMAVEDVVSILEGKHATHAVVQKYKEVDSTNPTGGSGPAAVSAEDQGKSAASTEGQSKAENASTKSTSAEDEAAAQNKAAAESEIEE